MSEFESAAPVTTRLPTQTETIPVVPPSASRRSLALHVLPERVLGLGLAVTLALTLVSLLLNTLLFALPDWPGNRVLYPLRLLLDLDFEQNLPSFLAACGLAVSAVLAGVVALLAGRGSPFWRGWAGLAGILAVMSYDEAASVHERLIDPLRAALNVGGAFHFTWVVAGLVFVAVFTLLYARFWWRQPEPTRRLLLVAGVLYTSGALGMEVVDGLFASSNGESNLTYKSLTALEEMLELSGLTVLLYALLTHLRALTGGHGVGLHVRLDRDARPVGDGSPRPAA